MQIKAFSDYDSGLRWTVRVVEPGEVYGSDNKVLHSGDEPLVEFYDQRYPITPIGQFVSRYYITMLLKGGGGLCLNGGVPSWSVGENCMYEIREWVADQYPLWWGKTPCRRSTSMTKRFWGIGPDTRAAETLGLDVNEYTITMMANAVEHIDTEAADAVLEERDTDMLYLDEAFSLFKDCIKLVDLPDRWFYVGMSKIGDPDSERIEGLVNMEGIQLG